MQWTEEYFTEEYLLKYKPQQTEEITTRECDFIVKSLNLHPKDRILDVACGYGRHVKELVARGYDDRGIDSCELYIKEANDPRCTVQDMRAFSMYPMDAIYNFFTSFGYYSDPENLSTIQCISDSLVRGGRFLLHVRNREWIIRNFVTNQWAAYDTHTELTDRRFDLMTSSMMTEITYWPSGKKVHQVVRFYTLAELVKMFEKNNMKVIEVYGGIDFEPYTLDSEWMAIVASRK